MGSQGEAFYVENHFKTILFCTIICTVDINTSEFIILTYFIKSWQRKINGIHYQMKYALVCQSL